MTERQEKILKAIIDEYIKEAQPVGSGTLSKSYSLGIGPAMIRQEMVALEKDGWLAQPHTSAGRVPTDKAYRFYINQEIGKKNVLTARDQKRLKRVVKEPRNIEDLNQELARTIAEISNELSVTGIVGGTHFIHGYSYLANEPEFENLDLLGEFMRFMDNLNHSFGQLFDLLANEPTRVFIGREGPIKNIHNFTIITDVYRLPHGERGFISVIGPKRMDYKKNMALVEYITNTLNRIY